jgi:hypothetical protein
MLWPEDPLAKAVEKAQKKIGTSRSNFFIGAFLDDINVF